MTQYTIAERQAIKDRLADEKYFAQDLALLAQLFPHHVLIGECKRVNDMNRLSLCKRMIYQMLTKVTEEQIRSNRRHNRINDISGQIHPKSISSIKSYIQEKASGWMISIRKVVSNLRNRLASL